MIKLTAEQLDELHKQEDQPLRLVDPTTNKVYFVIASDLIDQVLSMIDETNFDIAETYVAQSIVASNTGWDDPEMDEYDRPAP